MRKDIFLTTDTAITGQSPTPNMHFCDFYQIYHADMTNRLKPSSLALKDGIIRTKVLPLFGDMPMSSITPHMIRNWQNHMLSQNYSSTYLKTIDMHLFSVFKYASKYYDFPNPYDKAGHIGSSRSQCMNFWTLQEYHSFIQSFSQGSTEFIAFELLYWCGLRVGELLALTPQDIDQKNAALKISKTYTRHHRRDYITSPKTETGIRSISLPSFLCNELSAYISIHEIRQNERLVPHTTAFLKYHLTAGCDRSGVPCIRIHDIRHSHVSLLIDQGFSAIVIAQRVGHKHISTTLNVYSHLFPSRQEILVQALEKMRSHHSTEPKKESHYA